MSEFFGPGACGSGTLILCLFGVGSQVWELSMSLPSFAHTFWKLQSEGVMGLTIRISIISKPKYFTDFFLMVPYPNHCYSKGPLEV